MSSSRPADRTTARGPLSRLVPRSLTNRLIATTLLLVALVSVIIGTVTTVVLHHFLLARLDDQVKAAAQQGIESHRVDSGGPPPVCGTRPPGVGSDGFGLPFGTILARFEKGCSTIVLVTREGLAPSVPDEDVATLAGLSVSDDPRTVQLSRGGYRVLVVPTSFGRDVTALPTSDVSDTIGNLVVREVAIGLGCLILAGLVGQALVRRQLSPLKRVAATATEVTRLPLETGEVGVTARVPDELTDPTTEVGQVGSALNAMLGHVEQALDTRHESEQRVRQFLADASHELRTPLATILGYAELTRRTTSDPAAMEHAMRRIRAESGRMADLVNDLLLLARLDSGRPLERADVDISALLVETVSDARVVGAEHAWRLNLPPEPLHVEGDRDRLHQVVTNLLTNAIRHTPAGTVVSVTAVDVPGSVESPPGVLVTVHDDGPGLPEGLAGKEFERFSRGDTSRARTSGGAGLGLSIVQAIVAAHRGTVTIRSTPGDTSIAVLLPRHSP